MNDFIPLRASISYDFFSAFDAWLDNQKKDRDFPPVRRRARDIKDKTMGDLVDSSIARKRILRWSWPRSRSKLTELKQRLGMAKQRLDKATTRLGYHAVRWHIGWQKVYGESLNWPIKVLDEIQKCRGYGFDLLERS